MHGQRLIFANLNETIFHKKCRLACQWLGIDNYMQNVIKIFYVVKSYELLTDRRAEELK